MAIRQVHRRERLVFLPRFLEPAKDVIVSLIAERCKWKRIGAMETLTWAF